MMASLPQTPAQTGLASILAALGQAAPAGTATDAPGFEQLFANLPGAEMAGSVKSPANLPTFAATPPPPVTEVPVMSTPPAPITVLAEAMPKTATATPPAAALFGLPQPVADVPAQAVTVEASSTAEAGPKPVAAVKATPEAAPAADAAAAASLLIAVATPFKGNAPAADKSAPTADAPVDGDASSEAVVAAAPVAQPPAIVAEVPAAATIVAAAMPASEKPVADKPAKTAAATTRQPEAATLTSPASPAIKTAEAAQPLPAFAAIEPKAAKPLVDAGASMAVLFAQPDLQGATPLLEAAKAAPLAERTLDLSSDDQWIAQLAADIAATKSDKGDISFRLMPRHLGRLDVSMLSGDEGVTLKLDTHHEATATIVQAAQPRLVEDLRQQGVRVADAQVTHTPAETGRQQQSQSQQRGNAPDTSHLIETAADQADPTHDERTADRRGRFA